MSARVPLGDPAIHSYDLYELDGSRWKPRIAQTKPFHPNVTRVFEQDYGLVIRAPHPEHPKRFVLIMAGPHSVGTGAASLAATHPRLIRQIKDQFGRAPKSGINLADRSQAWWVLVKGELDRDKNLVPGRITLVDGGRCEKK